MDYDVDGFVEFLNAFVCEGDDEVETAFVVGVDLEGMRQLFDS